MLAFLPLSVLHSSPPFIDSVSLFYVISRSDGACGTVVAGNVPSCDACCSGSLSPVDRRTRD